MNDPEIKAFDADDDFDDEGNVVTVLGLTDEELEDPSYFEKLKALHFADGVPITYEENGDPDCEYYITEYPDGRKVRQHVSELNSENE